LIVQTKWKYLESIFKGQVDIVKQLPNENSVFNSSNDKLKAEMERIYRDRNALRALCVKGFLQLLNELFDKFEQI